MDYDNLFLIIMYIHLNLKVYNHDVIYTLLSIIHNNTFMVAYTFCNHVRFKKKNDNKALL